MLNIYTEENQVYSRKKNEGKYLNFRTILPVLILLTVLIFNTLCPKTFILILLTFEGCIIYFDALINVIQMDNLLSFLYYFIMIIQENMF